MDIHREYLQKKGWSEEEITHTAMIIKRIQHSSHPHKNLLNETVFWTILFLAIATMIATTYWIIPLFIAMENSLFYPFILIIGISFGLLYSAVIRDLDHLKIHHHLLLASAIPITTIISFAFILNQANNIINHHNTFIAGAVFSISFLAPHLIEHFVR